MFRRYATFGVFLAVGLAGCYSPTLPLPPPSRDGLTVEPPDAEGWVVVTGRAGVMEAGDQAVVVNLSTLFGWIVPVEPDGSFTIEVRAETGDWLSVQRRDGFESSQAVEIEVP